MKKIVPFKKDLFFENNINEITNISLEHTLSYKKDFLISGEFIIIGEYKTNDNNLSKFDFRIPCDINVDDKYDLSHVIIDIDDFYYEMLDNNALSISIDVLLDKLEDRCIDDSEFIEIKKDIEKETKKDIEEVKLEQKEGFVTYRVCIVTSDDTLESILKKYNTNTELLSIYNDITNIKPGDKIIIPCNE